MSTQFKIITGAIIALSLTTNGCDTESKQQKKQTEKQAAALDSLNDDHYSALALSELNKVLIDDQLLLPGEFKDHEELKSIIDSLVLQFKKIAKQDLKPSIDEALKLVDRDKDGKISADEIAAGIKDLLAKVQQFAPKAQERWKDHHDDFCSFIHAKIKQSKDGNIRTMIYGRSAARCGFPDHKLNPNDHFEIFPFCKRLLAQGESVPATPPTIQPTTTSVNLRGNDLLYTSDEVCSAVPANPDGSLAKPDCTPVQVQHSLRNRFVELCRDVLDHRKDGDFVPATPPVGGPCTYKEDKVKAKVAKIEKSAATELNCTNKAMTVSLEFENGNGKPHIGGPNDPQSLEALIGFNYNLPSGYNPPEECLGPNGIKVGASFEVIRKAIVTGSCTPVIFEVVLPKKSICEEKCHLKP